jgi:bifunctional non-homologous end joining protein LigD
MLSSAPFGMPDDRKQVSVGGHRLTLTNLDKVLYPDEGITKAEVVQYYLKVAPVMLEHIAGRPLSLVRFPDGIGGESFYQKNRPKGTPDWVKSATPKGEDIDYLMATSEADLAWLGNMAALEIHQQHGRQPEFDRPDYLVIDVDPPEGGDFTEAVEITALLREHVIEHGYHPLLKTTGGKGLHLVCPLDRKASSAKVLEAAKDLATTFRDRHPKRITLALAKAKRKDRVFLDILRHNPAQLVISPYSLRGRPGATVSLPITWEEMDEMETPRQFNLRTVPEILDERGDAWKDFDDHRTPLHTTRKKPAQRKKGAPSKKDRQAKAEDDGEPPGELREYVARREFHKTPEPGAELPEEDAKGNRFVVHRHHASRLHYDLRLEEKGVLKSWAVPKGLPPRPGITRLAVQTEDHPLKYIDFEGTIPEGQYGAGEMWVFDEGTYQHIKKPNKKRLEIRLKGQGFQGDFRLIRKEEQEWLLQRIDEPEPDWLREPLTPMALVLVEEVPEDRSLKYEVKWDGIRVLAYIDEGQVRLVTRNGHDVTEQFPELLDAEAFRLQSAIIDGEIVVLDAVGHPDFAAVLKRVQRKGTSAASAARKTPATCHVFDCLYLDGRAIMELPLRRRREWLADTLRESDRYRFSRAVDDGVAFFEAIGEKGLEGIVGKDPDSRYRPGARHDSWIKLKLRHEATCAVIGYSPGKGRHEGSLGALHIAELVDDVLEYRGRVGTGITDSQRDELAAELKGHERKKYPLDGSAPKDARGSVWVEPELVVDVGYAEVTADGRFRKPSVKRIRRDETVPRAVFSE